MIALIQRVTEARVVVGGEIIGAIDQGILALIGVEPQDQTGNADRLLERLLGYRVFCDAQDKMNLSVSDIGGGLLLVPQFTLAADTRSGKRPSFSTAAPPDLGQELFHYLCRQAESSYSPVAFGQFGADMKVSLCNDGPVTFWLTA